MERMTGDETGDRDVRNERGFLSIDEVAALPETVVLDPHSVLISRGVRIGAGNVFYPNVVIESDGGNISIGTGNRFLPAMFIRAARGSGVEIGDDGEFGPGGVTVDAAPGDCVRIGDGVRINGGATIGGGAVLGAGSQVLGAVTVRGTELAAGAGHTEPDPDLRGGVLKGTGRAFGLRIGIGEVINGAGGFTQDAVERQRRYHPDAPRA
jgi:carbonic anhydrase/acetyltransferase-like protein (isoleucine patch superfamily)